MCRDTNMFSHLSHFRMIVQLGMQDQQEQLGGGGHRGHRQSDIDISTL